MSTTVSVSFQGRNLWTFDVSRSILLAELIGVVEDQDPGDVSGWLRDLLPNLRALVVGDLHLDLDLGLTEPQRDRLLDLIAEANRRLAGRGRITAAEAAAWEVLDGETVIWRSAPAMDTAPIVELGEALTELVRGTLPHPPAGTWWFIGAEGGTTTIQMKGGDPVDLRRTAYAA